MRPSWEVSVDGQMPAGQKPAGYLPAGHLPATRDYHVNITRKVTGTRDNSHMPDL